MSEQNLWSWLRLYLPEGEYSRIESGDTSAGIPDVYYQVSPQTSGFLELKFSHRPNSPVPFKDYEDGIRFSQEIWISRNVQRGAHVLIVAQVGERVLFIPGEHVKEFNGSSMNQLENLACLRLYKKKMGRDKVKALWRIL